MHIAEVWRYPVKSMAAESLTRAEIRADGIVGDRVVHVRGAHGRVVTARTRPRLLGHRATLGPDGEPLVDGRPWQTSEVAQDVVAAVGSGARLVRDDGVERFDVLPLLVAAGVEGLAERTWEGRQLKIGEVVIGLQDLRQRCIMTTFHPDSLEQDVGVLRRIQLEFGGTMALNCSVVQPGVVTVGDPVELEGATES